MNKILLYDHNNLGYWELLKKTLCLNRSCHSGNHFKKALLLSRLSSVLCGWEIQHPPASKSCYSSQVRQGALQGLGGFCSSWKGYCVTQDPLFGEQLYCLFNTLPEQKTWVKYLPWDLGWALQQSWTIESSLLVLGFNQQAQTEECFSSLCNQPYGLRSWLHYFLYQNQVMFCKFSLQP